MKKFIKTQGAPGAELVGATDWAVTQDRYSTLTEDKTHAQYPAMPLSQTLHVLQLFIENHIKGHARDVLTTDPTNGLDSWRKLYHDQLPAVEHQKQMLLNEFHHLSKATSLKEMRERIQEMERITALWSQVADAPFDLSLIHI